MKTWYAHVKQPPFDRALWIVGSSAAGKSTISRAISIAMNIPVCEAGRWIREMHRLDATVDELTATTLKILGRDERYFSRLIAEDLARHPRCIISGSRNPIDFVDNFNVHRDAVMFLGTATFPAQTGFERAGVNAILAYTEFLLLSGSIKDDNIVKVEPIIDAITQV